MLEKIGTLPGLKVCTTSRSGSFLVTTDGAIWTVDVTYPDYRPRLVNIGHAPDLDSAYGGFALFPPNKFSVQMSDNGCLVTIRYFDPSGTIIKFCVLKNPSGSWRETVIRRERAWTALNEVYDRAHGETRHLEIFCPKTGQMITTTLPERVIDISSCWTSQFHVAVTTMPKDLYVRRANEPYRLHSGLSHELKTTLSNASLAGITTENLLYFYHPLVRRVWFYRFDIDSSYALVRVMDVPKRAHIEFSHGMTRPDTMFIPLEKHGKWTQALLMNITGPLLRPDVRSEIRFQLPDIPSRHHIHLIGAFPSETITSTDVTQSPFDILDVRSLVACSMVCKKWRVEANMEHLWHRRCVSQWGPLVCILKDSSVTWRDFYINRYKWLKKFCLVVINTDTGLDVFQMRRSVFDYQ